MVPLWWNNVKGLSNNYISCLHEKSRWLISNAEFCSQHLSVNVLHGLADCRGDTSFSLRI